MTAKSEHNGEPIYYNEEAEEWRYIKNNCPVKQGLLTKLKNKIFKR